MAEPELSDLQALEQFVVDNDKLLDLEARVGKFNIFDALGVVHQEIRHSNFLAWLLDPAESHGLGGLFLKAVLMDLLRQTPAKDRLFSPIRLDGGELSGIEVRREWKHIDLLITCDPTPTDPGFLIAIENKVRSNEHSDQLARYKKTVTDSRDLAKFAKRQFVYLTPEGDEPSEDGWTVYNYADLHRVLTRVCETSGGQMGDDVRAFLDHYLRLIGSRLMEDTEIAELCHEIYKNHRQAIDLIVEHAVNSGPAILQDVREWIDGQPDRWIVRAHTGRNLAIIPKSWEKLLPPVSKRPKLDPHSWIIGTIFVLKNQSFSRYESFGVTEGIDLREALVSRLVRDKSEFGMHRKKKEIANSWISLGRGHIAKWKDETVPDDEELLEKIKKRVDLMWQQMTDATPIISGMSAEFDI